VTPIKKGDLVVPAYTLGTGISVSEMMNPRFSSRGRSREWKVGEPALVVAIGVREVGGHDVLKVQILLDGEAWWIGAGSVRKLYSY
jgi:hypothetical protein